MLWVPIPMPPTPVARPGLPQPTTPRRGPAPAKQRPPAVPPSRPAPAKPRPPAAPPSQALARKRNLPPGPHPPPPPKAAANPRRKHTKRQKAGAEPADEPGDELGDEPGEESSDEPLDWDEHNDEPAAELGEEFGDEPGHEAAGLTAATETEAGDTVDCDGEDAVKVEDSSSDSSEVVCIPPPWARHCGRCGHRPVI